MKIRQGFVSNSSSSSFIVCFQGKTKEDAFSAMKKHPQVFNFSGPGYIEDSADWVSCELDDVIDAIGHRIKVVDKITKKDSLWELSLDNPVIVPLSFVFADYKHQYEETFNSEFAFVIDLRKELKTQMKALSEAKDNGLNRALVLEAGDNHGHIMGNDVALLLDYEGRNTVFVSEDLAVIGDCHH